MEENLFLRLFEAPHSERKKYQCICDGCDVADRHINLSWTFKYYKGKNPPFLPIAVFLPSGFELMKPEQFRTFIRNWWIKKTFQRIVD